MISLALGLAIAAFFMSLVCLVVSGLSLSYSIGLKKSTHTIQFTPLNNGVEDESVKDDFEDTLSTSFDDDEISHV